MVIGPRRGAVGFVSGKLNVATRRMRRCVARVTFSNTARFLRGCGSGAARSSVVKRFNLKFCSTFVMTSRIRVSALSCGRNTGPMR